MPHKKTFSRRSWRTMPEQRKVLWVRFAVEDQIVGPVIAVFEAEPRDATIRFSLEERAE